MSDDLKEDLLGHFNYGTTFSSDVELLEAFISKYVSQYVTLEEAYRKELQQHFETLRTDPPFLPVPEQPEICRLVRSSLEEWALLKGYTQDGLYLAAFQNSVVFNHLLDEVTRLRQEIKTNQQRLNSATIQTNLN